MVEMTWGKNSKKKPIIANNFCFLVDLIRPTGPMVTMVTRYTGGLSQHLLVEMSWEKNSREKPMIENNFCIHNPPPPMPSPLICQGGGGMGKKQHLLKRLEMTLSALLDHVFLCVTDEQSRHPPYFVKGERGYG